MYNETAESRSRLAVKGRDPHLLFVAAAGPRFEDGWAPLRSLRLANSTSDLVIARTARQQVAPHERRVKSMQQVRRAAETQFDNAA